MEWQQNRLQLHTNRRTPFFHQYLEDWGLLALCVLHYLQYTQLSSRWFHLTQIIKSRFRNCWSVLSLPSCFQNCPAFWSDIESFKEFRLIVRVTKYISNGLVFHFHHIYRLQAFLSLLIHLTLDNRILIQFRFHSSGFQFHSELQWWLTSILMSRVWLLSHFSRNLHMKAMFKKISQSRAYFLTNTMLPWLTLLKTTTTCLLIRSKLTGICWHSNRLGIKDYPMPALMAFTFRSRINKCILQLSALWTVKSTKTENDCLSYLANVELPRLRKIERGLCEGKLTKQECWEALVSMGNNKSPGNDGSLKNFTYVPLTNYINTL